MRFPYSCPGTVRLSICPVAPAISGRPRAGTITDAATFEKPHAYAAGVPYVLVNGIVVVKNGVHTGATPGALLRSAAPR